MKDYGVLEEKQVDVLLEALSRGLERLPSRAEAAMLLRWADRAALDRGLLTLLERGEIDVWWDAESDEWKYRKRRV